MSDKPDKQEIEDAIDKIDKAIAGDQSEANMAAVNQAIDYSWPEIQKHLIEQSDKDENVQVDEDGNKYHIDEAGRKVTHLSFDSWWLKDFKREDVLMTLPRIAIMNTKPWHTGSVRESLYAAYGVGRYSQCDDCFGEDDILAHIAHFPEGQFAAQLTAGVHAGNCAGMAVTMRTSRPPTAPALPWLQAIGDMRLGAHESDGDWLYGVEMAVHPMYRRYGIATGFYQLRFGLVKELNLRGCYAVGMLMGYREHARKMGVVEYGRKVMAGELQDPTVTLQLKRGFRAEGVVADYCDEPAAGDAGVLIVWENPDYRAGAAVK